jgi:hypothetical protein
MRVSIRKTMSNGERVIEGQHADRTWVQYDRFSSQSPEAKASY